MNNAEKYHADGCTGNSENENYNEDSYEHFSENNDYPESNSSDGFNTPYDLKSGYINYVKVDGGFILKLPIDNGTDVSLSDFGEVDFGVGPFSFDLNGNFDFNISSFKMGYFDFDLSVDNNMSMNLSLTSFNLASLEIKIDLDGISDKVKNDYINTINESYYNSDLGRFYNDASKEIIKSFNIY